MNRVVVHQPYQFGDAVIYIHEDYWQNVTGSSNVPSKWYKNGRPVPVWNDTYLPPFSREAVEAARHLASNQFEQHSILLEMEWNQ